MSEIQTDYLGALGRAMALAQNFERNGKYVLGLHDLWEAFEAKQVDLNTWRAFGTKLMGRSLGGALRKRESDDMLKTHIAALDAAREARNYFAHQAAEPTLYVPPMGGKHKLRDLLSEKVDRRKIELERQDMVAEHVRKELPRFEKAVRDLAHGDSIVSEWSYIIQEKDAHMPIMAERYAHEIAEWVLEPLCR